MKIILLILVFLAGCGEIMQPETASRSEKNIFVSIEDANSNVLYSELLPLIYVQHYRNITTNSNTKYRFIYDLPTGWELLFESSLVSFWSVESGTVDLELPQNNFYEFAITTQNE